MSTTKLTIKSVLSVAGNAATGAVQRLFIQSWLQQNGDMLITALQADNVVAAFNRLQSLYTTVTAARPVLDGLMSGTPDEAINAVAEIDRDFAERLRECSEAFGRLQSAWERARV